MAQGEAREVVLEIRMTDELRTALEGLRENARSSPALVPKGLSCSESREPLHSLRGSRCCRNRSVARREVQSIWSIDKPSNAASDRFRRNPSGRGLPGG
jgi:hypothetical protein